MYFTRGCGLLIVAMTLALGIAMAASESADGRPDEDAACLVTRLAVKRVLVRPETARFHEFVAVDSGDGAWTVTGKVNAITSVGKPGAAVFTATLYHTSTLWIATELSLSE